MKYIHGNGMDNKEINYSKKNKKVENYKEKGDKISWQQSYVMKYIHDNGMDNKKINYFIVKKIKKLKITKKRGQILIIPKSLTSTKSIYFLGQKIHDDKKT
jgi:hypothetical protein